MAKKALSDAVPDGFVMPFVENYDLFEALVDTGDEK